MNIGKWICFLYLLLPFTEAWGQQVNITNNNQHLNLILNELIEKNNLLITYDEAFTESIVLSEGQEFNTLNSFLDFLTANYPVGVDSVGNSLVLYQKVPIKKETPLHFYYTGQVIDSENNNGLPNAHLLFDSYLTSTSSTGHFSHTSTDSIIHIQAKHLGYIVLDTTIASGSHIRIPLRFKPISMSDVTILEKREITHNAHIGIQPGAIKLNPKFIKQLPGYGESSIYSFLRLMPGVLASGENPNDISVRGSMEGQNLYLFNNYRVYNPWYKLNDIGTINPLLIEDVEIYKSGYDASMGENIGGIINLKGLQSPPVKPSASVFINNFVVNGKIELPVNKKASLIIAGRKNIVGKLKQPTKENKYSISVPKQSDIEIYVMNSTPDYVLYDTNLKFNYTINQNSGFSLAAFGSFDEISLVNLTSTPDFSINTRQFKNNRQLAGSFHYYKTYTKGAQLDITASYSGIKSENSSNAEYYSHVSYVDSSTSSSDWVNQLDEYRLNAKYKNPFLKGHFLQSGIGATISSIDNSKSGYPQLQNYNGEHYLIHSFLNYNHNLTSKMSFRAGGRLNYSSGNKAVSFEPRFQTTYYHNDIWKFYASAGIFHQYTFKAYATDELDNSTFIWMNSSKNHPYYNGNNFCIGVRYLKNPFTISLEFYKKMLESNSENYYYNSLKKIRYQGVDGLVKYQNGPLTTWVSFTISDFKDKDYTEDKHYKKSTFDMPHEVKWAAAYHFKKFTFSANYIYGSGFKLWHDDPHKGDPAYSRLDMGTFYRINLPNVNLELGCSLLNALDQTNRKLDEFIRFGMGNDVISYPIYGVRRTPTFFLKINL